MKEIDISLEIERLLEFALKHKMIEKWDIIVSRNYLMDLFKIDEPYSGEVPDEDFESPHEILENMLDYAYRKGLLSDNTVTLRDLFDTKIMGFVMPRQSEVIKRFYDAYKSDGPIKATDEYYGLSKASNYIRVDRISKNLYWKTATDYGDIEITINLSKPEKDPKDIAKAKLMPQSSYPKCLLCKENTGYAGRLNHPARQNHRIIPLDLGGEKWYLQYSPYVYYNEHCIVFYDEHIPMKISENTFKRLFDFIEMFPHYFIGSNADLPIVGGSILTHEHFQGGRHIFAMEKAPIEHYFANDNYKDVKAGIVKWPLSTLRLSSKNKHKLINISSKVLAAWRKYSDESLDILAYSEENGQTVMHNTITPIARKNKNGEFEIDLVLRNNRTTSEYPYGIFHPHEKLHHIKKENIGLIEVMGLAVLPARLNTELKEVEKILKGDKERLKEVRNNKNDSIYKHLPWIEELVKKYGMNCTDKNAEEIIKNEVGYIFLNVLMDAGVYKRNKNGYEGFKKFLISVGFRNA